MTGGIKLFSNNKLVPPYVVLLQIFFFVTPSLVLLAFNLGLKDYDLARILVNGLLMGFLCLIWSTFMYVGEKIRSKDKGEPNLEMEEKYKFKIISFDNLRFFMKIP